MVKENNIVIYEEPNKLARPARVSFSNGSVVFHGYQEFILVPDSITVSAEYLSLQRKQELLAPSFCPRYLKRRTVLDLGAHAGFFSFWALQNGAANTLAVDIDESYLRLGEEACDQLDF